MKDLLIVIPAYREQDNILILCKKLLSLRTTKYSLKILIIDDSDNLITQKLIISSFKGRSFVEKYFIIFQLILLRMAIQL